MRWQVRGTEFSSEFGGTFLVVFGGNRLDVLFNWFVSLV